MFGCLSESYKFPSVNAHVYCKILYQNFLGSILLDKNMSESQGVEYPSSEMPALHILHSVHNIDLCIKSTRISLCHTSLIWLDYRIFGENKQVTNTRLPFYRLHSNISALLHWLLNTIVDQTLID